MTVFTKSFCLFCWFASFKKETKLKRSHARIAQTVLLLLRVSLKVARTYLFICARGLYMFLDRLFRQKRFNPFLWFLAPLIKNGATLWKWYLFSCRYKNIWDIGISTNWVIRNLRRIQFAIQREQLYAEWGARLKNFHSSNLLWIISLSLFEIVMCYETLSSKCDPRFHTCS